MNDLLTLLARMLIAGIQALPLDWAARLGRAGGAVAWLIDRRHRRVALDNLQQALGNERTEAEIQAMAKEHFRRLGENYVCAVKTAAMSPAAMASRLEIVGFAERLPDDGRNFVAAIGHFGNFELFARAIALKPDWTLATTYRALGQPALNALLQTLRAHTGVRFFERRHDAAALKETMSRGKVALGLLADQHAGDKGIWVPFFGRLCSTSAAPIVLAQRYHAVLCVGVCYRTSLAHWRIEFSDHLPMTDTAGHPLPAEEIAMEINRQLEAAVRRDPPNWFWVHRRWKPPRSPVPLPEQVQHSRG